MGTPKEKLAFTKPIPMTETMIEKIYDQIPDKKTSFAEMTRRLIIESLNSRQAQKEGN